MYILRESTSGSRCDYSLSNYISSFVSLSNMIAEQEAGVSAYPVKILTFSVPRCATTIAQVQILSIPR